VEKPTWCTQFSDEECSKDNGCLGVKNPVMVLTEKLPVILAKQIDDSIVNWSISCEK